MDAIKNNTHVGAHVGSRVFHHCGGGGGCNAASLARATACMESIMPAERHGDVFVLGIVSRTTLHVT